MLSKLKILILAAFFMAMISVSTQSYAALADLNYFTPVDTAGTQISSYPLTITTSTAAIKTRDSLGYSSLVLDVSGGGVTVFYELSLDGTNWYWASTTDGTTLTSTPTVAVSVSTTSWIVMTSRLTNYIRFTFVPTSGSPTISAKFMYQASIGY